SQAPAAEEKESRPASTRPPSPQQQPAQAQPAGTVGRSERADGAMLKASPLARRMAEEHNIDLSQVTGTGPGGRIVRDDIEDFLEQRQAAPQPAQPASAPSPQPAPVAQVAMPPDSEATPLSRVQAIIARRLSESKQ